MLQQTPNAVETDPRKYLTCIHGPAGVGKTSFGAQMPGHYFLKTQVGTKGVQVYGEPILSWEGFIEKCSELGQGLKEGWKDQREVKTVVIDVYEYLYAYAAKWICANQTFYENGVKQKFSRIEDVPYGKGYTRTNELLLEKLNRLMLLGFGVLVISQSKERPIKWRGQNFQAYAPNLPPTARDGLIGECDAVGFFNVEESTSKNEAGEVIQREEGRTMYWQSTFLITAKHRLDGFPQSLPLPKGHGYETYLRTFQETLKGEKIG